MTNRCRVVSQERDLYRIEGPQGEQPAVLRGRFRREARSMTDYPAVGDWVEAQAESDGGVAVIERVLPRSSALVRRAAGDPLTEQVIAANIDTVFVCMAPDIDFSLRRLERYLALIWQSGATPVVLLTKSDCCDHPAELLAEARASCPGVDVLALCAPEDGGAPLRPYLGLGKTVAFVGSSGVGKSTLVNRLLGQDCLLTGDVQRGGRGRHTSTRRQLLHLPDGASLIDTPGMREVGLWEAEEGLQAAFPEIEALARACRFRDCSHEGEPGCAVRAALASGELDESRFQAYRKLLAENRRAGCDARAAKEEKFKRIARINRSRRKED